MTRQVAPNCLCPLGVGSGDMLNFWPLCIMQTPGEQDRRLMRLGQGTSDHGCVRSSPEEIIYSYEASSGTDYLDAVWLCMSANIMRGRQAK